MTRHFSTSETGEAKSVKKQQQIAICVWLLWCESLSAHQLHWALHAHSSGWSQAFNISDILLYEASKPVGSETHDFSNASINSWSYIHGLNCFHLQVKRGAVQELDWVAAAATALRELDYTADVVLNESFCYTVQRVLPSLTMAQLAQVRNFRHPPLKNINERSDGSNLGLDIYLYCIFFCIALFLYCTFNASANLWGLRWAASCRWMDPTCFIALLCMLIKIDCWSIVEKIV